MKVPGNYDSYLIFNLEQLFHGNLFVLGDPSGSVNAPEAAAAAVLVEEDVIKLDLHEGGAGRQHLIMALGSSSPLEEGRKEGKSGSCSKASQIKLLALRAAWLWNTLAEGEVHHMTRMHLLCHWLHAWEWHLRSGSTVRWPSPALLISRPVHGR